MHARIANSTPRIIRRSLSGFHNQPTWVCASCQSRSRRNGFASSATTPEKPYYVTTPIFYVNAAPHVGHLYTMVLADIEKRWHVMKGKKAILLTGTDEHGLKVQRAAAKAGIEPKLFCDRGARIFKDLAAKAEIDNDHFMRTTDEDHKDAVQYAWFLLQEKGLIYEEKHEGWYSITDEAFYPESAVRPFIDPPTGRKMMTSKETGSEVEWSSETNYHFRLSAFRKKLLDFYEENPRWIYPDHRMQEVVRSVKAGLEDLSISRPYDRLTWGIRVPNDDTQTIYVWLDALVNYITRAGYPWAPGRETDGGWPADCQIIGKDIVRFHCIYWPAFLMALGLPLPKRILSHAHWTLGGSKMSKSTGRVVDPFHALDRYGSDVMRFYMGYEGGIHDDASYDNKHIIIAYNKILSDQLGNLASRVMRSKQWSIRGSVERVGNQPADYWSEGPGSAFYNNSLLTVAADVETLFESEDPRKALAKIVHFIRAVNDFFSMSKPWDKYKYRLADDLPGEDVDRIIFETAEALRIIGILLQPYMPNKAAMLLDQLGVPYDRRTFEWCKPGSDLTYGVPLVSVGGTNRAEGGKFAGVLFPPLSSEE